MAVRTPVGEHTLHLSGYVDLALADVLRLFSRPGIDEVFRSSADAVLGGAGPSLSLHVSQPEQFSVGTARATATWRRVGASVEDGGSAQVSLLMVQSGHDPMTEILVKVTVSEDAVAEAAAVTRRLLDEITNRLRTIAG
jgi:hypothetical protein